MLYSTESLDHRVIDTPWEPQPIIGISECVENNMPDTSHLVREVRLFWDASKNVSPEEAIDLLAEVDDQFRQIEALTEFKVAPTDWHVLSDQDKRTRVLARVGIVDGQPDAYNASLMRQSHESSPPVPPALIHARRIFPYIEYQTGPELIDVSNRGQYKLGRLRDEKNQDAAEAVYFIDIEPLLID